MNAAVQSISETDGSDHIWWLRLDADEFPHGPRGLTVREYLSTLDESFRIVGARLINHYPGEEPHYRPGRHPLDFQPLCEELAGHGCWWFHNNHPLQRFDRGRPVITCGGGKHAAVSAERPLFEPAEPIFLHHFPFRQQEVTRRRLTALFVERPDPGQAAVSHAHAGGHARARLQKLDAVYAQDWEEVGIYAAPELGLEASRSRARALEHARPGGGRSRRPVVRAVRVARRRCALMAATSFGSRLRRFRRLAGPLLRSPGVPFWVRSRLLWRRDQGFWLARRPDTFNGKVRWKMLKDRRPLLKRSPTRSPFGTTWHVRSVRTV